MGELWDDLNQPTEQERREWHWRLTGWRATAVLVVIACIPASLLLGIGFWLGRVAS